MKNRILGLFGILTSALLIMTGTGLEAASTYALAVSSSKLYQIEYNGTTMSSRSIFNFGNDNGGRDRSIAVYDNDIVLATEGNSIRKLKMTSTGVQDLGSISLGTLNYADSIAVTASTKDILVGDASVGNAKYAQIPTITGDVSVSSISGALCDVATSGSTGVILTQRDDTVNQTSFITTVAGETITSASLANEGTPRNPVAVTTCNGSAYVISKVLTSASTHIAALSAYDIAGHSAGVPLGLSDFVPTDVTTFTLGSVDYLSLIGKTYSTSELQVWRCPVSALGTWTKEAIGTDGGDYFQCSASGDSTMLWFSQPTKQKVGVLDTTTWTYNGTLSANLSDDITGLAAFADGMIPVPEPSSLLALASLGVGALGLFRRKSA